MVLNAAASASVKFSVLTRARLCNKNNRIYC